MLHETRRQVFHLMLGNVLALLVLLVLREKSVYFIGTCLFIGIIIAKAMHQKIHIPVFAWFIKHFERENSFPGRGVLHFFLGIFLASIFFDYRILFLSILVLAYGDSFSTVVGKGFGRVKIWNDKTLEGSLAAFAAGFSICAFYLAWPVAVLVAAISALAELLAPIDDNLVIPLLSGLVIYILT